MIDVCFASPFPKMAGLCKGLVRFVMYEVVVLDSFTIGFSRFAIRLVKVCVVASFEFYRFLMCLGRFAIMCLKVYVVGSCGIGHVMLCSDSLQLCS